MEKSTLSLATVGPLLFRLLFQGKPLRENSEKLFHEGRARKRKEKEKEARKNLIKTYSNVHPARTITLKHQTWPQHKVAPSSSS